MSDNSADVVEVLLSNVKSVFSLNYILVSLLTVIVYDTILTMPKEIKFLWGTEGVSLRKVLYIICRYYAIICLVVMVKVSLGVDSSLKSCQIYTDWYTSAGLPIEEALVNMLLILRINALYGGRRKVLFFISTLFLVELGCFFYAGVKAGKVVPFAPLPTGLSLPGCIIHIPRTPKFTFTLLAWVPALIFSAILLGFSIYKVREDLSPVTSSTSGRFTSMHLYHPLLLAILRQGAIFYVDGVIEFREKFLSFWEEANSQLQAELGALKLKDPDDDVIVTNLQIKQENHSIPCRTYVPKVKPELDEKTDEKFPLLYWLFGGGWALGTLEDNDAMLRDLAITQRITCVAIAYRLAPENPFPAPIDDAYAGLKWAVANADSISVDISKGVLVSGLSAGGNMAAVIAHRSLKDKELRGKITGQLLIVPVLIAYTAYPEKWKSQLLSMEQNKDAIILSKKTMNLFFDAYIGGKPENAFNPDFSPLLSPSFEDLPPAYIQIAGGDPLRDEAFLYDKLLKEAGVKTKVDVYPGVPHAFHAFAPTFEWSRNQDVDFKAGIKWLLGRSESK